MRKGLCETVELLPVCLSHHSTAAAAGLLPLTAKRSAGRRYRSTAALPGDQQQRRSAANASSVTLRAAVGG